MQRKLNIDTDIDDSELFRLIQNGNSEAFTILYQKYHQQLYVLSYTYLKNKSMAEDAIQHVFAKLWEYRSDILIKISLKNFLYTVTKNHILNTIRNENNSIIKNYQIAQTTDNYEDNLVEIIERKELMSAFNQALDLLPEQKRIVCMLKMDEKLSNQAIADKMQISINTVKTHYAQAIKMMRKHIEKMLIFLFSITFF